jgi:hypothetical protein
MQVFLDSDGVLADFDKLASEILGMPSREFEKRKHDGGAAEMWNRLYAHEDFFYKIPKMADADELVDGVKAMGFDPIVLTGIPSKDDQDMKQALSVIADKIARILNGDPYYLDNWHDIQGYAQLIENRLKLLDTPAERTLFDGSIGGDGR